MDRMPSGRQSRFPYPLFENNPGYVQLCSLKLTSSIPLACSEGAPRVARRGVRAYSVTIS